MSTYFLWMENCRQGPYTKAQLRELLQENKAKADAPAIEAKTFNEREPWKNRWTTLAEVLGPAGHRGSKQRSEQLAFECGVCRARLTVKGILGGSKCRCPRCQTVYSISEQDDAPGVFVVLGVIERRASEERRGTVPARVVSALGFFELGQEAGADDVRAAYRRLIAKYHPDKVSHLGPEFRRIAEEKSKEINLQYQIAMEWFK